MFSRENRRLDNNRVVYELQDEKLVIIEDMQDKLTVQLHKLTDSPLRQKLIRKIDEQDEE